MIQFDPATGLAYFSALFQGNLALLGILAALVTFKINSIEQTIGELYKIAAENVHEAFLSKAGITVAIETTSTEEFRESLDKVAVAGHNDPTTGKDDTFEAIEAAKVIRQDQYLQTTLGQIELHEHRRDRIIHDLKIPAISIAIVIVTALICFPFASWIHQLFKLELGIFLSLMAVQIIALTLSARYVRRVLKE